MTAAGSPHNFTVNTEELKSYRTCVPLNGCTSMHLCMPSLQQNAFHFQSADLLATLSLPGLALCLGSLRMASCLLLLC